MQYTGKRSRSLAWSIMHEKRVLLRHLSHACVLRVLGPGAKTLDRNLMPCSNRWEVPQLSINSTFTTMTVALSSSRSYFCPLHVNWIAEMMRLARIAPTGKAPFFFNLRNISTTVLYGKVDGYCLLVRLTSQKSTRIGRNHQLLVSHVQSTRYLKL